MTTLTANHCELQLDYCNYTQTYFAKHTQKWSHDPINRYLRNETIPPRQVWENVKDDICFSKNEYLLFDDTVVDKNYSSKIEPARRQYSGNFVIRRNFFRIIRLNKSPKLGMTKKRKLVYCYR